MDAPAPWAEPVVMTAEELLLRPDDYWRYELVDGRPVCMSATDSRRGRIVMALLRVVDRHVDKRHLGAVLPPETGFWICAPGEPDTFLAPDLAFVRTERAPDVETERFPRLAPDLVVEVASPSQRQRGTHGKGGTVAGRRSTLVWLVFPDARIAEVWHDRAPVGVLTPRTSYRVRMCCPASPLRLEAFFSNLSR